MSVLAFRTHPPVACADGQTRRPSPTTTISLHDLQDLCGWAAIGAKHYQRRDVAREMQARCDLINRNLALLGYGETDDFNDDA